jgi:uncharacterized membrane protein
MLSVSRYRGLVHLGLGIVSGLVVGVATAILWRASLAWLLAWSTGTLTYSAATWLTVWRLDGDQTRERATSEDIGRALVDLAVLTAALVSVTVIGLVLVGARAKEPDPARLLFGLLAIVGSWLAVHTMFWVRYARRYYSDQAGGINFHDDSTSPRYSDFAYLAFTVAMTFQVSDTDITHNFMRRAVLGHAATSFVFITVILAVVINLVGGLGS